MEGLLHRLGGAWLGGRLCVVLDTDGRGLGRLLALDPLPLCPALDGLPVENRLIQKGVGYTWRRHSYIFTHTVSQSTT